MTLACETLLQRMVIGPSINSGARDSLIGWYFETLFSCGWRSLHFRGARRIPIGKIVTVPSLSIFIRRKFFQSWIRRDEKASVEWRPKTLLEIKRYIPMTSPPKKYPPSATSPIHFQIRDSSV